MEIRQPDGEAARQTRWIDDLNADPGWLVFYTHDVSDTPTEFGCKPETFERLVSHAVKAGRLFFLCARPWRALVYNEVLLDGWK